MSKNIIITGVSTGIGRATAKVFLKANYRVFGSVRKPEDALNLSESEGGNFQPLVFDITDEQKVIEAAQSVEEQLQEGERISGLVNNAGIALGGPLEQLDLKVLRKQFEVNVIGTLAVTKAFLPLLKANSSSGTAGKIINISSVAGKRALPFTGPYSASKHALEGLSDALRMELQIHGIDVILIEPGPIKSEIWNKMPDPENNPFSGTIYEAALRKFYAVTKSRARKALPAGQVGELILKVMQTPRPRTRYVITEHKWRDHILPGLLPDRLFDKKVGQFLGLLKQ